MSLTPAPDSSMALMKECLRRGLPAFGTEEELLTRLHENSRERVSSPKTPGGACLGEIASSSNETETSGSNGDNHVNELDDIEMKRMVTVSESITDLKDIEANYSSSQSHTPVADSKRPHPERNDPSSDIFEHHKKNLSMICYIAVNSRDLPDKKKNGKRILKIFQEFNPYRVDYGNENGWWYVLFLSEKEAITCFESCKFEKIDGKDFAMQLVGEGGKKMRYASKIVLEQEDEFDKDWVGFELLKATTVYCKEET